MVTNPQHGRNIGTKVRHLFILAFEWIRIPKLSFVLHVFSVFTFTLLPIQVQNWWCSCRDTTKCKFYNMKIIKVYFQPMWIHAQVFAAADKKKRNWKRPSWPPLPATTHHGCRVTEARGRQSNFPQQLIPISYFGPMTFLDNGNVFCILWYLVINMEPTGNCVKWPFYVDEAVEAGLPVMEVNRHSLWTLEPTYSYSYISYVWGWHMGTASAQWPNVAPTAAGAGPGPALATWPPGRKWRGGATRAKTPRPRPSGVPVRGDQVPNRD